MKKPYYCPRCKSKDINEYDDTFDCIHCNLEFDKKDCDELDDDQILSIKEKLEFVKNIKEK